jgi:ABC-2 type transport system ATP-binding protein
MAYFSFDRVSVRYNIYNARSQSLRHQLISISTGGRLSNEVRKTVSVTALDDVSFVLNDGDRVGVIGHNGAGKTTLLRTMAGIYKPFSGTIVRSGAITTIIELGAGMDIELSGYENVARMGMLLGHSKEAIRNLMPSIVEFSDLGDFMSMPVRTYSSGMMMRLMFGVATAKAPDILLLDEMFGVGDKAFQERAEARMRDVISSASILVFASHDVGLIKSFCRRIFKLEHGRLEEVDSV